MSTKDLSLPDIERQFSRTDEQPRFARFCNSIVLAETKRPLPTLPKLDDSPGADGGIDGAWELPHDDFSKNALPFARVGWNVFQYKCRSTDSGKKTAIDGLKASVKGAALAVIQRTNKPGQLRQYTLFTNLGLGRAETSVAANGKRQLAAFRKELVAAILAGLPATEKVHVEIVDGAFLQAAVNRHPAIRQTYFGSASFHDWFEARKNFQTHEQGPTELPMIGRDKDKETLKQLIDDPTIAFIGISGASGMGKSRLVFEATKELAGEIFFVRNVAKATLIAGNLKDYASLQRLVMVVEDLRPDEAKELAEQASTEKRLKIITTIPAEEHLPQLRLGDSPQIRSLRLTPLNSGQAGELLKAAGANLNHSDADWVIQEAGGNPQIILAAAQFGSPLIQKTSALKKIVATKFCGKAEALFGIGIIPVLEMLSCLAPFNIRRENHIAAIRQCLGVNVDAAMLRLYSDKLTDAGFLEGAGRSRHEVSVSPPLLATFLLERILDPHPQRCLQLYQQLDADGKERLFERLISVEPQTGQGLWTHVFGPTGPFAAPGALESEIKSLATLSRAAPLQTAEFLLLRESEFQTLLGHQKVQRAETLAELLNDETGRARRNQQIDQTRSYLCNIVHDLVYHSDSAHIIMPLLERAALVDADKKWGGSFRKTFGECFAPWYYAFPLTPDERWTIIQRLLQSANPAEQTLGCEALIIITDPPHTLSGHAVQARRIGDSPKTVLWAEIYTHKDKAFSVHLDLALGSSHLQQAVLTALPGALRELEHLPPDKTIVHFRRVVRGFFTKKLAIKANDLLGPLVREKKRLEEIQATHGSDAWAKKIPAHIVMVERMIERFLKGPLLLRLAVWVDGDPVYGWEKDPVTGNRRHQEELKRLACEFVTQPHLLTVAARAVILNSDSYHARELTQYIGMCDKSRKCWSRMLSFHAEPRSSHLFAVYCQGVALNDRAFVEKYLDANMSSADERTLNLLRALGPTPANRVRLMALIKGGRIKPNELAWMVSSGNFIHDLPPKEVLAICRYVHSPKNSAATYILLQIFSFYLHGKKKMSPILFPVVETIMFEECDHKQDTDHDRNIVGRVYALSNSAKALRLFERLIEAAKKKTSLTHPIPWNPLGGISRSMDFFQTLVEINPRRIYHLTLEYLGSKTRMDFVRNDAILFDLEKHAESLLAIGKKDPSLVPLLATKLVPTQAKFWEFTYELIREFPSDARLRSALTNLFDERMGWGYYSERLVVGLNAIETARKQRNVPAHAIAFLDEARNELIRRRNETLAREQGE